MFTVRTNSQPKLQVIILLISALCSFQLRYSEDEIDYLNDLDAERSLFNAELHQR
jgi:hypothetical protein